MAAVAQLVICRPSDNRRSTSDRLRCGTARSRIPEQLEPELPRVGSSARVAGQLDAHDTHVGILRAQSMQKLHALPVPAASDDGNRHQIVLQTAGHAARLDVIHVKLATGEELRHTGNPLVDMSGRLKLDGTGRQLLPGRGQPVLRRRRQPIPAPWLSAAGSPSRACSPAAAERFCRSGFTSATYPISDARRHTPIPAASIPSHPPHLDIVGHAMMILPGILE